MFMQRLITSLILVPLVLLSIFYANFWVLGALVFFVTLLAGKECCQLIPLEQWWKKVIFLIALFAGIWVCGYYFDYWQTAGLILWLIICVAILTYPESQRYWGYPVIVAGASLLLFPLFIQSLVRVYYLQQGQSLLIYLFFLVWAADVGAYLMGKLCGQHKLIPKVSPGKSWEGLIGGFLLALAVATAGYIYYVPYSIVLWFSVAVSTVIISIFGDLFISILKRRCHLKDTGDIIPGHGGILDRLDSLIAALPVFYFGLTYIPLGI